MDDLTEEVVLLVSIASLAIAFGLLVYSSWGLLYGILTALFVIMVGLYIFSEFISVKIVAAIFMAAVIGVFVGAVLGLGFFAGVIASLVAFGILGIIAYIMSSSSLEEE